MTLPVKIGLVKSFTKKADFMAVMIDDGVREFWVKLYEPYWMSKGALLPETSMMFLDCGIEIAEKKGKESVVFVCYHAERLEPRNKI